ncbi:MAG: ParA family protein [Clostridia bacterium]|nr:ParA family protein [Clostridia bacterium]
MGKIISITNQKGGVGKTTTCVNLAAFVAKEGYKVLIIDMDPQGNASSAVGVEPTKDDNTIYEVLIGECSAKEAISPSVMPGLDVLPSTVDLSGAEVELVHLNNRENVLKEALVQVKREYDFIFIDCPPSLSLLTVNALTATDSIIIPIQCEYFALVGLGQLMNTVKLIKKHLNPNIEIEGVLLTMKDARSNLVNQVAEEIQKYFKEKVYNTFIPRNIRLAESPSHGKPITMYEAKSKGAIAYQNLAYEFLASNKKN